MIDIEIPLQPEKTKIYRWLERLPAILSYSLLALPFVLSLIDPRLTAFFIIAYLLLWFFRGVGINIRVFQGYSRMKQHEKLPWQDMAKDISAGRAESVGAPSWHTANIERNNVAPGVIKPDQVIHAIMIATYNESRDVLEPTIKSVLASNFDMKKVMLVIAYEERGGSDTDELANSLVKKYGSQFMYAAAVKHPDGLPNEVVGKGGNITFAGRELKKYLAQQKIDPLRVVVTTLDADNRPHPNYLPALTYTYSLAPDPRRVSFQPIPIFTNNIWDVPALMRVIATGNSFWNLVLSLRPHAIRNFASHAQSMAALIDTDFWSVRTIVEDGHQYWRSYFRYDGQYEVYPLFIPIYQDAVLASTYRKTLKAQFIQIRRWAWGASDIAYVVTKGLFTPNNVPRSSLLPRMGRLIESHVSWATGPLLLAFSSFIPILFNPDDIASNQLPNFASRIQQIALVGLVITMYLSFRSLPPKPARYKRHQNIFMALQWVLLPITSILYNSMAALYSQTRLFTGKYLDKFDVTEKAVKKD